jgi:hypothetical protein
MAETFYLIAGLFILLAVLYDFFYTTLSGSGAAFLTKFLSASFHSIQIIFFRFFGRNVFKLSGILINLGLLTFWMISFWVSLFLIYTSDPDSIVNSTTLRAASASERLYYTGYVLSTLGNGDFRSVSAAFQLLTSVGSFLGFIFFTTSMTYLISVSSAVIHKRSLALAIQNLGETPSAIVKNILNLDSRYTLHQIALFQQMIDRHSISHHAYPVLHYYINSEKETSLSINISKLDEAVSILLSSPEAHHFNKELQILQYSLDHFLEHMESKYDQISESDKRFDIDWKNLDLPEELSTHDFKYDRHKLNERRQILHGLLKNEGYTWDNVYSAQVVSLNSAGKETT